MNTFLLLSLFSLVLSSTVTGQESVQFFTLLDSTQTLDNGAPLAVQVENEYLKNVSLSLLMAETWVRTHVLAHYPSTNVSIIIVGKTITCNKNQENYLALILPAIKNIHYSLTRWGLQNDIKVSVSLISQCFDPSFEFYIKPLFNTLQKMGSPYVLKTLSDENETLILLKSHFKSMKNYGFLHINKKGKTRGRKLSFLYPSINAPTQAPSRISIPAFVEGSPLPPLVGMISPSTSPPSGPHLPPCSPSNGGHGGGVGAPAAGGHSGLWCVAKPNVPSETLQEALDFACGEGEADCEAIRPQGSCYFPDNVVAHASYAFNSYWQKSKKNGGSCGFGGTAMLINSDPSYRHCRFVFV
ncbi:hypothetical protein ACJIZ3_007994 [Penstemon smallii]|uniref:X8 domain-containing protein n=1 Tax=Penstemon smallii TaxID=265156 RepID=A0ABD3T9I8_9LAMI